MTTTTPGVDLVFSTVPTLTTCSQVTIEWTYLSFLVTTPTTVLYPLVVTNIGINPGQGGLNHRGGPPIPRQDSTAINMTLSQISPSAQKFIWSSVNVPQGQYRLSAYTPTQVLSSNIFAVNTGVDVSCLTASSHSSQSSLPSSSTPFVNPTLTHSPSSGTSSTSNPSATSPTLVSSNSSPNKGVIAGGVIGGVAVLALIAVVALWIFRRRRAVSRNATPLGYVLRKSPSKAPHSPSGSMGAILPFGRENQENSHQLWTPEEEFGSEKFAAALDDIRPNSPPIAVSRPYSKSLTSGMRPMSMTFEASFDSRETGQPKLSHRPRRSLDSSVSRNSTVIPPSLASPSHHRQPSDRNRRASRKPVPVYDPNEFPGSGTNDIPLTGRSETSLGDGKRTHYIIPDAPLEQRN